MPGSSAADFQEVRPHRGAHEDCKKTRGDHGYCAASPDYAWRRPDDCAPSRGVCAGHGGVPSRPRLLRLGWVWSRGNAPWAAGNASAGPPRLEADIRKLLIIGATAWLTVQGRKSVWEGSWLARILAKKPKMLVTIALPNRMARQLWAMMTKREDFREPVVAGAA